MGAAAAGGLHCADQAFVVIAPVGKAGGIYIGLGQQGQQPANEGVATGCGVDGPNLWRQYPQATAEPVEQICTGFLNPVRIGPMMVAPPSS